MRCIGELYEASVSSECLSWERILVGLAVCAKAAGSATQLARLTNMERGLISQWLSCKQTPSFKRTLELCYVLGISPLQLMTADSAALEEAVQAYSCAGV
jgi:transcriptional regulator with XRE-family HTH domain